MRKHLKHKLSLAMLATALLLCMVACRSKEKEHVISTHKLEAILYDYHLAQGLAQTRSGDALIMLKFQTAILDKHGVSQEDFDASMAYYMRHTEKMHDIYERLSNRLSDEAVAQGSSLSEIGNGGLAANGDTANVWKGQAAVVLNPYPPFNRMDFNIKSDTTFHAGDRVTLDFNAQFIYQDGIRDAIVMLAVTFNNDSTATQIIHASNTSHYSLGLTDSERIGIKTVRGFFLLPSNNNMSDTKTTLRMALITDIRLVRMHITEPKTITPERKDSATERSIPETAPQPQSLTKGGEHSSSLPPTQGEPKRLPIQRKELSPLKQGPKRLAPDRRIVSPEKPSTIYHKP
ncbi:MAG: DUF4296 domain-containing protein [Prevotella sp.]|nr:DUF4296 domain-containing protein [Prevotella sp.]